MPIELIKKSSRLFNRLNTLGSIKKGLPLDSIILMEIVEREKDILSQLAEVEIQAKASL